MFTLAVFTDKLSRTLLIFDCGLDLIHASALKKSVPMALMKLLSRVQVRVLLVSILVCW